MVETGSYAKNGWTPEGLRKGFGLVWQDVYAGVNRQECVGILSRRPKIGKQGGTADILHLSL